MKEINFKDFNFSRQEMEIEFEKIEKWMLKELTEVYLTDELNEDLQKGKNKILKRLNALIIRQYWGWEEMQMFLNESDEIIVRSLSLLKT